MQAKEDKQVFEVNVTKKQGMWTAELPSLNISASDSSEDEMKTKFLEQLKNNLNMNRDTHGAFIKRKWYVTVRPKRGKKVETEVDEDDETGIFDLYGDVN